MYFMLRKESVQAAVQHYEVPYVLAHALVTVNNVLSPQSRCFDCGVGATSLGDQVVHLPLKISLLLVSCLEIVVQLLDYELLAEIAFVGGIDRMELVP